MQLKSHFHSAIKKTFLDCLITLIITQLKCIGESGCHDSGFLSVACEWLSCTSIVLHPMASAHDQYISSCDILQDVSCMFHPADFINVNFFLWEMDTAVSDRWTASASLCCMLHWQNMHLVHDCQHGIVVSYCLAWCMCGWHKCYSVYDKKSDTNIELSVIL